ncbi:MAG: HNH endonuclease [Bacillota bacterium]
MQKQEFLSRWLEIIKKSSAMLVYKQNFINTLLGTIRNCSTRHTYDTAWARAVVEFLEGVRIGPEKSEVPVNIKDTAASMIRYYWDQTVYFGLLQGPNPLKQPEVVRRVQSLISEYYKNSRPMEPVPFQKTVFNPRLREMLDDHIHTAAEILKNDVIPRYIHKGHGHDQFIKYHKGEDYVEFPQPAALAVVENNILIIEAVYFRWAQILENFNTSPRLNKKVRVIDTDDLRDRPLTYYTKYLDIENPEHLCFQCGQPVADEDLFISHVLPWTYLCSDDIWNMVYTHKKCRSAKTEPAPSEFTIARLDKRNRNLLNKLASYVETDMVAGALQDAVNRGLLRKYWQNCQL